MRVIKLAQRERGMEMGTKEMTRQVRISHWIGVIREQHASGQTKRSWCRENGIGEKTYYYWQRKIREAACEQMEGKKNNALPILHSSPGIQNAPVFTEVKQQSLRFMQPISDEVLPNQLQMKFGDARLTVDMAYPIEKLALLIREITRP